MEFRVCTHCKVSKVKEDFYSKGHRLDSRCKECAKELRRKRYQKHKKPKRNQIRNVICHYVLRVPENPYCDALMIHEDGSSHPLIRSGRGYIFKEEDQNSSN